LVLQWSVIRSLAVVDAIRLAFIILGYAELLSDAVSLVGLSIAASKTRRILVLILDIDVVANALPRDPQRCETVQVT
jgi:hypothetical protein